MADSSQHPSSPDHAARHPLIRAICTANLLFSRGYHGLRMDSPCLLPPVGPGILICNHTSGLDPLLLQSTTRRLIVWMMAREYYDFPVLNRLFRLSGMIPTSRNGRDMPAMRSALRALEEGRILGIFPEGRIEKENQLLPFHPGVAMLAMRSGAPVYPARLDGSQRGRSMLGAYLLPGRSRIRFGLPLQLPAQEPTRAALRTATDQLRSAIQSLSTNGKQMSRVT